MPIFEPTLSPTTSAGLGVTGGRASQLLPCQLLVYRRRRPLASDYGCIGEHYERLGRHKGCLADNQESGEPARRMAAGFGRSEGRGPCGDWGAFNGDSQMATLAVRLE